MNWIKRVNVMWKLLGGGEYELKYHVPPVGQELFCLKRLNDIEDRLDALEKKKKK